MKWGEKMLSNCDRQCFYLKLTKEVVKEKKSYVYWTPCATHWIDLILEDFKSKFPLHKEITSSDKKITTYIYSRTGLLNLLHHFIAGGDLIRLDISRFAISYLCLGCLNEKRRPLLGCSLLGNGRKVIL